MSTASWPPKQVCQARRRSESAVKRPSSAIARAAGPTSPAASSASHQSSARSARAGSAASSRASARSEQTCRQRQVVARERPPARGREMARGALAERPALRVDRTELAQVLVGLLEVPAERLVVLDGSRGARLEPVGEAAVQLRAGVLEQAPVGRVADQDVMEAQRRLAEKPAGVGLDQLAAPQRFEPRVEIADLARQELGQRSAREVAPDHRGPLEQRALLGAQALDAGGEQRVDGGRHLDVGERDARRSSDRLPA